MLQGGTISEGHTTEIGFVGKQKVPAIFKVLIAIGKTNKMPTLLAYSMAACCVAQGLTLKKLLKAMHQEIEYTMGLKAQQVAKVELIR